MTTNATASKIYQTTEAVCQNSSLGNHCSDVDRVHAGLRELKTEQAKHSSWWNSLRGAFGAKTEAREIGRLCRKLEDEEKRLTTACNVEKEYQKLLQSSKPQSSDHCKQFENWQKSKKALLDKGAVSPDQVEKGLWCRGKELELRCQIEKMRDRLAH